jgi:hypothetical protein
MMTTVTFIFVAAMMFVGASTLALAMDRMVEGK